MDDPFQLADVLSAFVNRSGYTAGQLARLSGIPKPTIVNWIDGRVRRPRTVDDLLRLALVLHLDAADASRLLRSAGHPALDDLRLAADQTGNAERLALLDNWRQPAVRALQATTAVPPFQAPADLPTFVGRAAEREALHRALTAAAHSTLYSIQGMGGVGKTALAAHVAYALRRHFVDGVLWADVNASDTLAILHTFAAAYGVDVSQYRDAGSRSRVVRELLANKRALMVLDNVERSDQVLPLLPPTGACAVLITTRRHDLAVARRAQRFLLHPFAPETDESLTLFATVLGEERVAAERPLFVELAQLLGHLPLAVDIAAARLAYEPGWQVANFLQRVRQTQRRLVELAYEDQSVRLSFSVSYQTLTPTVQQLFAALGLFQGEDFSDVAAAALTELPLETAQDGLRRLFAMSLVLPGRAGVYGRSRYRLHPLLRAFAQAQLRTAANESLAQTETAGRYITYFIDRAAHRKHRFDWLEWALPDVQQAIRWAVETERPDDAVRGVNALYPLLEARGWYEAADAQLTLAQQQAALLDPVSAQTAPARLHLLHHCGRLADRRGRYIEAESQYEAALALARTQEDPKSLSQILRALGTLAARRGDYVLADAYYKEGLGLARALGYGNPTSNFLRGLGVQAYIQGHFPRAEAFYEEGLALMDVGEADAQDARVVGGKLWGLGFLAREQQDFAQAQAYYEQSLALAQQISNQERVIVLLRSLAGLAWDQQQAAQAADYNADALRLARDLGHRWLVARCLSERGEIQLALAAYTEAEAAFRELYELARIVQSQELIAAGLFGLARVAAQAGEQETAVSYAQQSLDAFTAIGHYKVNDVKAWLAAATA